MLKQLAAAVAIVVASMSASDASERVITTLTPDQIASNDGTYFNCDHEGKLGCLIAACKATRFSKQAAATVQYLYRDVADDFPELLTARLSTCFINAGGKLTGH